MNTLILDACCGGRAFWQDKHDPDVTYCDIRQEKVTLCDGRQIEIAPDVVADFRKLPFADGAFHHVVFDPPHLLHAGQRSWLRAKYGTLDPAHWRDDIRAGLSECWRVLAPGGTLVFKWSEIQIHVAEVKHLAPVPPRYGTARGRGIFLVYVKPL